MGSSKRKLFSEGGVERIEFSNLGEAVNTALVSGGLLQPGLSPTDDDSACTITTDFSRWRALTCGIPGRGALSSLTKGFG